MQLVSSKSSKSLLCSDRLTTSLSLELSLNKSARRHHHNRAVLKEFEYTATVYEWPGLKEWRSKGMDKRLWWNGKDSAPGEPTSEKPLPAINSLYETMPLAASLSESAIQVLNTACPRGKATLTHRAWQAYCEGQLPLHSSLDNSPSPPIRPARPTKPHLVTPKQVPKYDKNSSMPLSAHMLHNLAHIELNAIDLAWDTVARFSYMRLPEAFYKDFARVADDESRHLGWCLQRLEELGHDYGDMVAHDLLWEGAQISSGDLNARLAIIPLSQEARGLDAGTRLMQRLLGHGDKRSAAIVALIAAEEKAHVAVGVVWFQRVCAALGLEDRMVFRRWIAALCPDVLKGPFNHEARNEVGLPRSWYDITSWPSVDRDNMISPAEAASIRGSGKKLLLQANFVSRPPCQTSDSDQLKIISNSGGGSSASEAMSKDDVSDVGTDKRTCSEGPQVISREQMDLLQVRLAQMLDLECGS